MVKAARNEQQAAASLTGKRGTRLIHKSTSLQRAILHASLCDVRPCAICCSVMSMRHMRTLDFAAAFLSLPVPLFPTLALAGLGHGFTGSTERSEV